MVSKTRPSVGSGNLHQVQPRKIDVGEERIRPALLSIETFLLVTTPLEKKLWFFLTPEAPLIPKPLIYIKNDKVCSEYKGFGIEFCQNSILQALGQQAASRRGFFPGKNSIPENFEHV